MDDTTHTQHAPAPRSDGRPASRRTRWATALLTLGGLVIAWSPSWIRPAGQALGLDVGPGGPESVIGWDWGAALALVVWILLVERRGLDSVLLRRPSGRDIEWALWLWGIGLSWIGLMGLVLPAEENSGTERLTSMPIPLIVLLVVTVAITEELILIAYPIERITEVTGRRWLAVTIVCALFIAPHITFFGWSWLPTHGVAFGLGMFLYLRRRNLWANMLHHFLGNIMILIPAIQLRIEG